MNVNVVLFSTFLHDNLVPINIFPWCYVTLKKIMSNNYTYSIGLLYDCLPNSSAVTPHWVCSQLCTVALAMTNFASTSEIFSWINYYTVLQNIYVNLQMTINVLPSPSSYSSPHNRAIHQETSCWDRNRGFIWTVSRPRRWWTHVPKNHLPWVRS